MNTTLHKPLDFLRNNQNADGGWGYRPGGMSWVEPTAFGALALNSAGGSAEALRALGFLKRCQLPDGAVGLGATSTEGCWAAYAALLAFHGLGARAEEEKLRAWILGFVDSSSSLPLPTIRAIKAEYRIDASITGWPWMHSPGCSDSR